MITTWIGPLFRHSAPCVKGCYVPANYWYPRIPGDRARDTMHLPLMEVGALTRMEDHYHMHGKLPANAEILLRICGAISLDEQIAVKKVATEFFEDRNGFLFDDNIELSLAKSRAITEKRRNAGQRGAASTNGKKSASDSANTPALVAASDSANATTHATHNYNYSYKDKNTCANSSHDDEPPGFADCWDAYPKREGGNPRKPAMKAYKARVRQGVSPAELLAGTERYAAFVRAKGQEGSSFVKQAATFYGPDEHWREPWDVAEQAGAGSAVNPFLGAI